MARIAVVGAGAWGTALAAHAARLDHAVTMWALEPEVALDIRERHENTAFLPRAPLPHTISASSDPAEVVTGADLVILVPPSSHLREVASQMAPHVRRDALVVVASKGIERGTLALMSQVISEAMPEVGPDRLAVLSGPSFAREVVRGLPTNVVVAGRPISAARAVQRLLHAPQLRVYASSDPIGVQIGGATKNVIAIAAGAGDGLRMGTNARAALITRGLTEITRIGRALGARPLTFLGLSGVGDLVLTCTGDLSRNRTLGKKLAEGVDPQVYLAGTRAVTEGFSTSAAVYDLAHKLGVDTPIIDQVFHVLHRGRPLLEALRQLVTRDSKDELVGIEEEEDDSM